MASKAIQRLGILALALALGGMLSLVFNNILYTFLLGHEQRSIITTLTFLLIFLSMMVFVLTKYRISGYSTLRIIGIVYVILIALLMVMAQASTEWWLTRIRLQGISWVCVWIVLFPLVMPLPTRNAMKIAFTMALMGPIGLTITVLVQGKGAATLWAYIDLTVPHLIAAAMAIFLSRHIYNLGRDIQAAREMGSYVLEEKLGEGGMGEVWKAKHRLLVRPAAIKLIKPDMFADDNRQQSDIVRQNFYHEARMTSLLSSPHTVNLYDFGVSDEGTYYYVMELLKGNDLRRLVTRYGVLPANRSVYLLCQICNSLADAHTNGLLHRDIKPANIFICRQGLQYDFIKVLDFGLAKKKQKMEQQNSDMNAPHSIEGSPAFLAPEAFRKNITVDERTDIYAVGCVAYWLLTGKLVFEARSPMLTALAHAQEEPPKPSDKISDPIPADVEAVILSCLDKDMEMRPANAELLAEQFLACDVGVPWTSSMARDWWEDKDGDQIGSMDRDVDPDALTEAG